MSGHLGSSVKLLQKPRPQRAERLAASRSTVSLEYSAPGSCHAKGSVNGPAKLPPFEPAFPLFEHDRPDHGLTARTADRAVLVNLDDFLPRITSPLKGL